MKVKLDENIPADLRNTLGGFGHVVDTVAEEGLQGRCDSDVWAAAQQMGALLITQDLDFSDIRKFQPGSHYGILLVRLREPGRGAIIRRVRSILETEPLDQWQGCLVVATDRKIRIRRPES